MGRARRTRQAITIRFDDSDAELIHWLGQFAQTQTMTKVVKLACYMLSGIQPEEGLLALLPEVQQAAPVQETPAPPEETSDALAAVMQELWALREELTQQRTTHQGHTPSSSYPYPAPPPTLPEQSWPIDSLEPVPVSSSGLDLSSPRRRRTRPPEQPTARNHPAEPIFDADDARRRLVDSIHAYGKEFQRGR